MALRKVYIRYKEDLPDGPNVFAALDGFRFLGTETAPFYGFGDIDTLSDLGPDVGIIGYLGDVHIALKKLGKPVPEVLDYPLELRSFLGREVRATILREIRESVGPIFLKPVAHKLFTGFVWKKSRGDRLQLAIYPSETPVWVSDVVNFVSEYRVFVLDGKVIDARRYKGDWSKAPDRSAVEAAVREFKSAPRAYALDFGVNDMGKTLLVEVNDSYALGHYGLRTIPYARMIEARWEEMTQ